MLWGVRNLNPGPTMLQQIFSKKLSLKNWTYITKCEVRHFSELKLFRAQTRHFGAIRFFCGTQSQNGESASTMLHLMLFAGLEPDPLQDYLTVCLPYQICGRRDKDVESIRTNPTLQYHMKINNLVESSTKKTVHFLRNQLKYLWWNYRQSQIFGNSFGSSFLCRIWSFQQKSL